MEIYERVNILGHVEKKINKKQKHLHNWSPGIKEKIK